ncbi:hypothetical protein GCM10010532_052000 [Dactylosporangium siamense]|uniref:Uncharacterized protein n=2 Tax=Dactylosporangium siamense TaxID=685454 RepID=A0A919PIE3_9ACTN|nr:hypothetical protein Dsi01nite_034610 [Dactylosporangium siamense]
MLLVAAALVLVLLSVGGVVAWRVFAADPRDAAKEYFARLAAGDANGALKIVDASSIAAQLPTSNPLLSAAALSDPAARPRAMTVTHVTEAGDTAMLAVRYQANDATVTQALTARRQGRRFVLVSPFVRLSFAGAAATDKARITVNGVAVDPAGSGSAFPGAYTVTADGNALLAGRSTAAVPSPDATATVTLPPPSLSADGQAKADAAVTAALQQCAAKYFQPGSGCPAVTLFNPPARVVPGSPPPGQLISGSWTVTTAKTDITVTITKVPVCTFTPDAGAVTFSAADGVVHWDVKLAVDGKVLTGQSGDTQFTAKGRVALDADGTLHVTFA